MMRLIIKLSYTYNYRASVLPASPRIQTCLPDPLPWWVGSGHKASYELQVTASNCILTSSLMDRSASSLRAWFYINRHV